MRDSTTTAYGDFLRGLVNDPKGVSAPTPSSPALARVIAAEVDLSREGLVIELGPGTGVVTEALLERGLREGKTASRALGYQQVLAELDGEGDFEAAAAATAQATRRFVRKQRSWFRRDKRIHWYDGAETGLAARVLDTLGR